MTKVLKAGVAKPYKKRGCSVCIHPERRLIETWLADARTPRAIGLRVNNLSRRAIRSHLYNCQSLDEVEGRVAEAKPHLAEEEAAS